MRVLAIETATPAQSVALLDEDRLLAEASYDAKGSRGGLLLPTVDHVLRKAVVEAMANVELLAQLVGNGAARYGTQLKAALGKRVRMTESGLGAVPSAAVIARMGRTQLAQGTRPDAALVPVYLRRTEAEVNWDKGLIKLPVARLTS